MQALKQSCSAKACASASSRPCPSLPVRPATCRSAHSRPVRRMVETQAVAENQGMQVRLESQVRDGRVKNISASDVSALQKEGWVVLDCRPPTEADRAPVANAVHVPLFVPDASTDLASFIKKSTDFAMGSWWLGGTHYVPNTNFMGEVQAKIPKDARVIVACQKGLRSLAACEQLARAGYSQVAWVNGGFDTAKKGDIATTNNVDVRYGGIGGLSEAIGWTDVQREESKSSFLGGLDGVIKIFVVILVADLALFAYEQITFWQTTGTGPFSQ